MSTSTIVIPTHNGAGRIARLLASLDGDEPVLVVDNASSDGTTELLAGSFPHVDVLTLPRNEGFSRAVNLGAREIDTTSFVLLNDDCVCESGFAARITAALDAKSATVMAAGVLLERSEPGTLDSAGIELDDTLLVFDYLNGHSVDALERAEPPVGPSGAAAAYDRAAFLDVGGFDETMFAYWEDVDLALRLRREGAQCALAPTARAFHEHSATLGSGSSDKNFLTGFGRGYMLRKWSVLRPARAPKIVVRDGLICCGQAVADGNLAGLRGRVSGWRAAAQLDPYPYPAGLFAVHSTTLRNEIGRRVQRRRRLAGVDSRR